MDCRRPRHRTDLGATARQPGLETARRVPGAFGTAGHCESATPRFRTDTHEWFCNHEFGLGRNRLDNLLLRTGNLGDRNYFRQRGFVTNQTFRRNANRQRNGDRRFVALHRRLIRNRNLDGRLLAPGLVLLSL